MKKSVFGLTANEDQARHVVDSLIAGGFPNKEISILCPSTHKEEIKTTHGDVIRRETSSGSLSTEKHSKAPEGGVTGATAGGILGGSLGLLAGIGALAIPGLGPFIAAGPIMAALSGTALGGGVGLVVGALVGAGIPEYEAKKYEAGLKQGNILISVHANSSEEIKHASEIMKNNGAKDISSTSETTKSKL